MSKPFKYILGVLGILLALVLVYIFMGLFTPKTHHGSVMIHLSSTPEKVWEDITAIEGLPQRRPDSLEVKVTGINDQGYKMWREYTAMDDSIDAEITEELSQQKVVMHRQAINSDFTSQWVYELTPTSDTQTDLTITEDSTTTNLFLRAWMTLRGRNSTLNEEIISLKNSL